MTRVTKLTGDSPDVDRIKTAEANYEPVKVTLQLSPLIQFIIEGGIQHRLHVSRTAATRELLEAAALDWLEAKGYTEDSPEFQQKYLTWLTRKPQKQYDPDLNEEVDVYKVVGL
jgi:galactokinase